jgi:hypothetical protein
MTLGRTPTGAIKIKTDGGLRAVECACCGGCGCRSIKITDPVLLDTLLNATTGTCHGVGPLENEEGWRSTANGWSAEFYGELSPGKWFFNTASFDFASKCFSFYLDFGNLVWAGTYEDKSDQCGCGINIGSFDLPWLCEKTVFTINGIEFPAYHESQDGFFDPMDSPQNTPPVFTFS